MEFLSILYFILGYWAYGYIFLRDKVVIGSMFNLFLQRLILGALFGWALIPIAILMKIFEN